jgi:hypothetical protein
MTLTTYKMTPAELRLSAMAHQPSLKLAASR